MSVFSDKSLQDGSVKRFVTSDDFERLKQLAKRKKRISGLSHHEALEAIAQRIKFGSWHQVALAHKAMLPTENAVKHGVVIAMDVSEADGEEIVLAEGRFVADNLLPTFYKAEFIRIELEGFDEEDGRPNREKWSDEQLREFAREALESDLVFYRFDGQGLTEDPKAIVEKIAGSAFWGPAILWVAGQRKYDIYHGDATL